MFSMFERCIHIPRLTCPVRTENAAFLQKTTLSCSYPVALAMIASGKVNVRPLVTHRFKLESALDAFKVAKTGEGGAIKVIIQCSD